MKYYVKIGEDVVVVIIRSGWIFNCVVFSIILIYNEVFSFTGSLCKQFQIVCTVIVLLTNHYLNTTAQKYHKRGGEP